MDKLNTLLAEIFTSNFISIVLGLITGTMINLFTSDDGLFRYPMSIIAFALATAALVGMLRLRDNIGEAVASADKFVSDATAGNDSVSRDNWIAMTPRARLSKTINLTNPGWGKGFLALACFTLFLVVFGIYHAVNNNGSRPEYAEQLQRIEAQIAACTGK